MMRIALPLIFLIAFNLPFSHTLTYPQLRSQDGNLVFQAADGHNISFKTIGGGILLNGANLADIRRQSSSRSSSRVTSAMMTTIMARLNSSMRTNVDSVKEDVLKLNQAIERLQLDLETDECLSNPCHHGGQCFDGYKKFQCRCPDEWMGYICTEDVNECLSLQGTDLGCQNDAQCVNEAGSFKCNCKPNWYGKLCTEKVDNCQNASNEALCGHGTCINQNPSRPGGVHFKCICDPGWQNDDHGPSCLTDVNECNSTSNPCDLEVECENLPGSFRCGPCPQGYTGNGHRCTDINECMVNNGGCSVSPFVVCNNLLGSFHCEACPPGFTGDGKSCRRDSACDNHDCSPMATCVELPGNGRRCDCQHGMVGNGIGASGCRVPGGGWTFDPCRSNPCVQGTCTMTLPGSYTCVCPVDRYGTNCENLHNPCSSSPCLNGGTCIYIREGVFGCECGSHYTGPTCQTAQSFCGDELEGYSGELEYPVDTVHYGHDLNCVWKITSYDLDKVISLKFIKFDLENSSSCSYDKLTIYDGQLSDTKKGDYCGNSLTNEFINSTGHVVTLKFVTDHSDHATGFLIHWSSVEPVCGELKRNANHGRVQSPGYPNYYPANRDCRWIYEGAPGTYFHIQFAHVDIEPDEDCDYDYLEIRDGLLEYSPILRRICNSALPAPIETTGPAVHIHFHTDFNTPHTGFLLTYSSINSTQCGGISFEESGVITSPDWPTFNDRKLHCTWLIAPSNPTLTLSFTHLKIEGENLCQVEYVEVRKGNDELSPLLGKFCGTTIPPPLTVYGSSLYVIYKTEEGHRSERFRAEWKTDCSRLFEDRVGIIKSPKFPSNYPPSQNCTFVISAAPSTVVELDLNVFNVHQQADGQCNDYLLISGSSEKLCGSNVRRQRTYQGSVVLSFVSDSRDEATGFEIMYYKINNTYTGGEGVDDEMESSGVTSCGGLITRETGLISSPSPDIALHNFDCTWVIEAAYSNVIEVIFLKIKIEEDGVACRYDYVEVFDDKHQEKSLGRFCGNNLPANIRSSDNYMSIHYHTDHNGDSEGFQLLHRSVNASSYCGGILSQNQGMIATPGYPSNYHRKECVWHIRADANKIIKLNITMFKLENSASCAYDYLEIRNGAHDNSPLIGKYCGTEIPPTITSLGSNLYLKFRADDDIEEEGFVIYYDSTTQGCGGTLRTQSGTFMSPNYPATPYSMGECNWKIVVSKGSKIKLLFQDFDVFSDTDCIGSYVSIDSAKKCGHNLHQVFESVDNEMNIVFSHASRIGSRGFLAHYYTNCNVDLNGLEGVIESPNYPSTYSTGLNCNWTIKGAPGNNLILEMVHFKMNNGRTCNDYVEIFYENGTLLRKVCDDNFAPVNISASTLKVTFVSKDAYVHSRSLSDGFKLRFKTDGCGEKIVAPYGVITSPNYPNHYNENHGCHWIIKVDPLMRINLTIHDIDIEAVDNCIYDYLKISSGSNDKSMVIANLCHSQRKGQTLTSFGNELFLEFFSDHSMSGRGFNISWEAIPNVCGSWFSVKSATITTPNYPRPYDHFMHCIWYITTEVGSRVRLKITDFDLEEIRDQSCQYDSLRIYQDHETLNIIEELCGTLTLPKEIMSDGNTMALLMQTDDSINHKGFSATYYTECGGIIRVTDDAYGTIHSPSYPDDDTTKQNCTWIIKNDALDEKITLEFLEFKFESGGDCNEDYMAIYNGEGLTSSLVGKYCNFEAPPPITSMGSVLTVSIVSKGSDSAKRFLLIYSRSTSVCGFDYSVESGTINSPNYPDFYPNNAQCTWNITTTRGNKIELTFITFELEGTMDLCGEDNLVIKWAGKQEMLCSELPQFTRIIEASSVLILLKTNAHNQYKGFSMKYATSYGGHLLNWKEGSIESPSYSSQYGNNRDITWILTPPNSQTIRFIFDTFDLESSGQDYCHDFVEITEGTNTEGKRYCGKEIPPPIITSGTPVKVHFYSDYSIQQTGFRLTWRADEVLPSESRHITYAPPLCGGEIVLDGQSNVSIISPDYPNNYGTYLDCLWKVRSLSGLLRFTVVDIDIEDSSFPSDPCSFDWLEIVDVTGNTLDVKLCGGERFYINRVYSVASQEANVAFKTDYDDDNGHRGFKLSVSTTCDRSFEHNSGVITSPNYSQNYPSGLNCSFYIKIEEGQVISLSFQDFEIACSDPRGNMNEDYIEVFDGPGTSISMKKECGTQLPQPLTSSSNQMVVRFISNSDSRTARGFKAIYMPVSAGCGGTFELSDEIPEYNIQSPNYPDNYPTSSDCIWVVTSRGNERITATFTSPFRIHRPGSNCTRDYLVVKDGGNDQSPLIDIYCGDQTPKPVTSSGNALYFKFISDLTTGERGFKVTFRQGVCGGTYVQPQGTIVSPNYPQNYPDQQACQWIIEVPVNHFVTLSFEDLDIQDCSDKLVIRDFNATGPVVAEVCTTVLQLSSASNVVVVQFTTDNHINSKGFKINYLSSSQVCGGEHTLPTGTIESPNFPHALNRRRFCEWTIRAPIGRRVAINFTDFDFNVAGDWRCSNSSVTVLNGMFEDSPTLFRGCELYQTTYSSSYNVMVIKYSVSERNSGKGFRLVYNTVADDVCSGWHDRTNKVITSQENLRWTAHECIFQVDYPTHSESRTTTFHLLPLSSEIETSRLLEFTEYPSNRRLAKFLTTKNFPPLGLSSPSASFKIRFQSQRVNESISYVFSECGGMLTNEGYISTSNYPLTPGPGQNCVWQVTAPPHNIIKFVQLGQPNPGLNCDDAYVELKNGIEYDSPVIFKTCNVDNKDYRTQGNTAKIGFYSKKTATKALGFSFRIEFASKGCGGWHHEMEGQIHTPNWPEVAPEGNSDCHWYIRVPSGYHISATFKDPFDIPCNDFLQISSPSWNTSTFCGSNKTTEINVPTNEMDIHLVNSRQSRGFKLEYKSICGMNFSTFEGQITTPNYPNHYYSNTTCTHYINLPSNFNLTFSITTTPEDLQAAYRSHFRPHSRYGAHAYYDPSYFDCLDDCVKVGSLSDPTQIEKMCHYRRPRSFTVRAPVYVKIIPHSIMNRQTAFSIDYRELDCNQTLTAEFGMISSPHQFSTFQAVNCTWFIELSDERMIIRFKFKRRFHSSGCGRKSLTFSDILPNNTAILLKQLCTDSRFYYNVEFFSTSRRVRIDYFKSTTYSHFSNYLIEYQSTYKCGGVINQTSGLISAFHKETGPNAFYEPNLNCEWLFYGPPNTIFDFHWDVLSFPNSSHPCADSLRIYDNVFSSRPTFEACQSFDGFSFRSASNQVKIIFVSDDSDESRAMKASFHLSPSECGQISSINDNDTKTISTPYKNSWTRSDLRCQWKLGASEGKHIEIDFTEFDFPESEYCSDAYFHITEREAGNPIKVCGKSLPHKFISITNQVILTYYVTEHAFKGHSGFTLTYKLSSCNREYTYPGGLIESDGLGHVTDVDCNCTYTLTAPNGYAITLMSRLLHITSSFEFPCRSYLEVSYNLAGIENSTRYCHGEIHQAIPTNRAKLLYFSQNEHYGGFKVMYTMYPIEDRCGGVIKASSGFLKHPASLSYVPTEQNCTWTILNPKPQSMQIRMTFMTSDYTNATNTCGVSGSYLRIGAEGNMTCYQSLRSFRPYDFSSAVTEKNITVNYVSANNSVGTMMEIYFQQRQESNQDFIPSPRNNI